MESRPERRFGAAIAVLFCLLFLAACGPAEDGGDGGTQADSGSDAGDGGPTGDGGSSSDAGPPEDTWTTYAQAFFNGYCTGCHPGGARNYTTIVDVRRDATRIRCGVSDVALTSCDASSPAPQLFPVGAGPFPSITERQRLVAWIDAGLPE